MSPHEPGQTSWPAAVAALAGAGVVAGALILWADRGLVILLDLASVAGSVLCL